MYVTHKTKKSVLPNGFSREAAISFNLDVIENCRKGAGIYGKTQ